MHLLLVGNPNCGKTTLFNALTGDNQRIGNWPGVTVEQKAGFFAFNEQTIQVTDLPGLYSLTACADNLSQDEQLAATAIATTPIDLIVNVIDACHLERHLYLTSQLLELGKPVVIILNMIDIAEQRGIKISTSLLSQSLKCPVLSMQAHKKMGIENLIEVLKQPLHIAHPVSLTLPIHVESCLKEIEQKLINQRVVPNPLIGYYARRLLEGDNLLLGKKTTEFYDAYEENNVDIICADARYQKIHDVVTLAQKTDGQANETLTAKIDRIVLHRFWALPLFFLIMYVMFLFAINIGGAFQDFFDITTDAVFVHGVASVLHYAHTPSWLIALIANGAGKGINTTLTFIPVIASMYFFLSLLEISGYMARAAFVVDRVMRALGLPGKSFVPMIVGFGCNVPAILAARTLDSKKDRLLTILMSPFMSCSARLAIYTVFVAAFFPSSGQNIVFSLYLIGILMAVFMGFVLRKTLLQGPTSPLILELPAYHRPTIRRLVKETALRLRHFVVRAGAMIIPVCVVLGSLNVLTFNGHELGPSESVLSLLGQWLTPLFEPMGLHQDNWPATVGLLTGTLAKEVVVGSLNSLYAQMDHISQIGMSHFDFFQALKKAWWSIPQNFSELGARLIHPFASNASDDLLPPGMMVQRFDGQIGAYAYLLFILLYIPCISTMAMIRQEASQQWMWFSIVWSLILAYVVAVLFYQTATFLSHPAQSLLYMATMIGGVVLIYNLLKYVSLKNNDVSIPIKNSEAIQD